MGMLLDLARRVAVQPEAAKAGPAKVELPRLAMLPSVDTDAEARKAKALAFLSSHPDVKRACFADVEADPDNIILTVAIREPWGAVEVLVERSRFDAFALIELSLRYPDTSVFVPEH